MHIRDAQITDSAEICRLNREGLGYEYPPEKTLIKLTAILGSDNDRIFVAEDGGALLGYIHLAAYECTYSDSLKNVLAMVVDEGHRRQGVGRQLMRRAEEWAKSCGSMGIRLVSGSSRTVAHQFYRSCGFTLRKEQKNFIKIF